MIWEYFGMSVQEKVEKYAQLLKSKEKVDYALNRLDKIAVNIGLLSATGVGKIVNQLRNDPEHGAKAQQLVEKWKKIAKDFQSSSAYAEQSNASNSGDDLTKYDCSSSSSKTDEEEVKPKLKKRKQIEELDPFAAALRAADDIKITKPKRLKPKQDILDGLQHSLNDSSTLRPFMSIEATSSVKEDKFVDPSMARARNTQKMYSGRRRAVVLSNGEVPKLFDLCMKTCINNIDAIEETGNIPADVLRPVLEKCTPQQLAKIVTKNKYLQTDTDYLWERHCHDVFPVCEPKKHETWRQCFLRLTHERDDRLKKLSEKINNRSREYNVPQRKAMLADPIAPKDARRRQIKNGIVCSSSAVPNAVELTRCRRQIFETGSSTALKQLPAAVRNVNSTVGGSNGKKAQPQKKGALMLKTLKMMKGRPR